MGQTNLKKANANTDNYVKTQMGENHEERDFTIIIVITMVFSGALGFLGLIDRHPSALEGIYYLYRLRLLDKAVESSSV